MTDAAVADTVARQPTISAADLFVRRLLFVPDGPTSARQRDVHRIFSASIALSALRCLVSYVLLPVVSPALGAAAGVGPAIGIPLSVIALVFDVRGIRRFWLANHRWRWAMSVLYLAVMALVMNLLVSDIVHVVS